MKNKLNWIECLVSAYTGHDADACFPIDPDVLYLGVGALEANSLKIHHASRNNNIRWLLYQVLSTVCHMIL